ncbi:MAG: ABC transporter permease [Actinomycetota bacterium]|nr:ABC transporter permease [Actinomycetota bacterium]
MNSRFAKIRDRSDLVALGLVVVASIFIGKPAAGGIYGVGIVAGATLALQAAALVLVHRTNRIINFAQVQLAILSGVLFRLLVQQRTFLVVTRRLCPPCMRHATRGVVAVNYWMSFVFAILVAVVLSAVIYSFVIKRFNDAPRLIATFVTIGLAQLLASVQLGLPGLFADSEQRRLNNLPIGQAARPAFDVSIKWYPQIFHIADILIVAVGIVAIGGVFAYLRYSRNGVAIRSVSDNPMRAATLGMNPDGLTLRVWLIAGALAAISGVIPAMGSAGTGTASLNVALLVRVLAVAVIASMTSLPVTVGAAFAIGVLDQKILSSFGSGVVDGVLFLVILGVLMLQRYRSSRVDQETSGSWRMSSQARPVPNELREVPSVRSMRRAIASAIAIAAVLLPWVVAARGVNVFTTMMVYAMIGLSLLILSGWAGQMSLGQFALAGIGGFVATMLAGKAHLPMPLDLLIGGMAGAVVAIAVGLPALKLRGMHLAITTLAASLATASILLSPQYLGKFLPETIKRPLILGIDFNDQRAFYYLSLGILVLVTVSVAGLRNSRIGRALIASRDNDLAAQSFGIDLLKARLGAFAMAGFIAAVAGSLFAYQEFGLKPPDFSPEVSVLIFLMTVIGGLGSIAGALLGATYIGALNLLSSSPAIRFFATGGGVVALLLLFPGGIAEGVFALRDSIFKRIAIRRGIHVPSLIEDSAKGTAVKARLTAKTRPGGGTVFVPSRYKISGQWALARRKKTRAREEWTLQAPLSDEESFVG